MSEILQQSRDGAILTLTLNRPEKRNALSAELLRALRSAIDQGIRDANTRVMIVTGVGKAFCSGLDLRELREAAGDVQKCSQTAELLHDILERIYLSPKPVIAAVNGFAVAGGAGLMSVCDIVVALRQARIGYPEIKRGLVAAIVMPYLSRQVGERRAKHLLLTGELISAEEAKQIGLVDEVVPTADLMMRALHVARQLAELAPSAVALTKKWLTESQFLNYDRQREQARNLHTQSAGGEDAEAGAGRFLDAGC